LIFGHSYSTHDATGYQNTYTTLCTTDISSNIPQEFPVVTYSPNYDGEPGDPGGIIVAWDSYDDPNNVYLPFYMYGEMPIAEKCDYTGAEVGNCNFLIVPYYQNTFSADVQSSIALSGRDDLSSSSDSILYVWSDDNDMERKSVSYADGNSSSDWRIRKNIESNTLKSEIFPNPNNGNFTLNLNTIKGETINVKIYNSFGQLVYSSEETSSSDEYTKQISLNDFGEGIYLIRESGTAVSNNWKVIITK